MPVNKFIQDKLDAWFKTFPTTTCVVCQGKDWKMADVGLLPVGYSMGPDETKIRSAVTGSEYKHQCIIVECQGCQQVLLFSTKAAGL